MIYNVAMSDDLASIETMHTIAHMYCRGYSIYDISRATGQSIMFVARCLDNVRSMWKEQAILDFNERISYELQKLDHLETMYWEAWERSKLESEVTFAEEEVESEDHGTQRRRSKRTTASPPGDPRFLEGVRWCVERRCQLLGLDAPKKSAVFTASVDMAPVYNELESEERQRQLVGLIKSLSGAREEQHAEESDVEVVEEHEEPEG